MNNDYLIHYRFYPPLAVDEMDADMVFLLQMLRQMFGAIDGSVLASRTAESHLQMFKTALDKPLYMMIHEGIDRLEESEDLAVLLQKIYHRLIQPRQGFVFVILTGIMGASAIKHISAAIAGLVLGNAAFKREGVNGYS